MRQLITVMHHLSSLSGNMRDSKDKKQARREARKLKKKIKKNDTSGVFDSKAAPTEAELADNGNFATNGLYVGHTFEGHYLTNPHDGHCWTQGSSGVGKTTRVSIPTLIQAIKRQNVIVIDIDLEIYRSVGDYLKADGVEVEVINPLRNYNTADMGYNPLMTVQALLRRGEVEEASLMAGDLAKTLIPPNEKEGDHWIAKGGGRLVKAMILTVSDGKNRPLLTLLYQVLAEGAEQAIFYILKNTENREAKTIALRLMNEHESGATKQTQWVVDKAAEALEIFRPDTAIAESVMRNGVDFSEYRKGRKAAFVSLSAGALKNYGQYLSIVIGSAIDQVSRVTGDRGVLFLLDEIANIPPISGLQTYVQILRKSGIQFSFIAQSEAKMADAYGKDAARDIKQTCTTVRYLNVPDHNEAKQLSEEAGTRTAYVQSISTTERMQSSGNISAAEQKLPRIGIDKIKSIPSDEQLVRLYPLALMEAKLLPWWDIPPWNDGRIKDHRLTAHTASVKAPLLPRDEG